jgi:hypothetical protein
LPHWIWAPLPAESEERDKIVTAAISGGADVIAMVLTGRGRPLLAVFDPASATIDAIFKVK